MKTPDGHTIQSLVTSPDGAHWAATTEADGQEHVVVDGEVGPALESVYRPVFCEATAIYKAEDDEDDAYVVHGGGRSGPWVRITQLSASGGRWACLAKDAKRRFAVVVDGEVVDSFKEAGDVTIAGGAVAFWASLGDKQGVDPAHKGNEVIFVGDTIAASGKNVSSPLLRGGELCLYLEAGAKWTVWHRGEALGEFEWVSPADASADGDTVAFGVRTKGRWGLWRGGKVQGDFDDLAKIAVSQNGAHVAYAAQQDGAWQIHGPQGASTKLARVSTVEITDDGRAVWVGQREDGLVVGIGDTVHGPYEGLGQVRAHADGKVRYRAKAAGGHALFVDGVALEGRYEMLSNPVDTDAGGVAHALADGAIERVEC
jgi:hypothetical protein